MKVVIVFYHARRGLPLREANASHLRCWQRYSKYRTVYVNVAFPVPWSLLQRLDIVAVIFDTIFLSMHWSPDYFVEHAYKCDPVKQLRCPKIGVVQDEFTNMKCVVKFLADVEITHLLTASTAADWPTIYNGLDFDRVQFRTVLTGYVDEKRLKKVKRKRLAGRKIDIGYRAWANPYWLGEHGLKKVQIAEQVAAAARNRSLVLDISNPEATRFLIGDDSFDSCKTARWFSKSRAVPAYSIVTDRLDGVWKHTWRTTRVLRSKKLADSVLPRKKAVCGNSRLYRHDIWKPR